MQFQADAAVTPSGIITDATICVKDGYITDVSGTPCENTEINAYETVLLPGFVDLHVHGGGGADTMDGTMDALKVLCRAHGRCGTTTLLATTMTESDARITRALENVALAIDAGSAFCPDGAQIAGVHLEGPFINPLRAGAQPAEHIRQPNYAEWLHYVTSANGHIKRVTIAAEYPEAREILAYCWANHIAITIGHTMISGAELQDILALGPVDATHLFNAMNGIHHRIPGPIPTFLTHPSALCELIADGFHIHPDLIRMTYQTRGSAGIIAITDAMAGMGCADGHFELGGHAVTVSAGRALLADGTLAGSVLGMSQAARNLALFTGCSVLDVVRMTSANAAQRLGRTDIGRISIGARADFVHVTNTYDVQSTTVGGIPIPN